MIRPHTWPRRPLRSLLALTLLVTAVACTGTFEEGAPIVLLSVSGGTAANAPATIEAFVIEPPTAVEGRRATPLGAGPVSGVELTRPVLGWDWVDRDATIGGAGAGRSELVVLSGVIAPEVAGRDAWLLRYDVSTFDLAAPALTPLGSPVPLVRDGAWDVGSIPVEAGFEPTDGVCLAGVSTSSTGRFAVLLDRRGACGGSASEAYLYVVDLELRQLVWSSTPDDVAPVAPFIDQGSDRADVWRRVPGATEWAEVDVEAAELTGTGPDRRVDGTLVDAVVAGDDRWLLTEQGLRTLSAAGTLGAAQASATGSDRRFVETGAGLPVVIVGGSDLWVHPTPAAAASRAAGAYRAGVTDAPDRMTYLLRAGAIDALDLLVFDPTQELRSAVRTLYRDDAASVRLAAPRLATYFRPPLPPTP